MWQYFLFKAIETRLAKFGLENSWHRYSLMISYTYYGSTCQACAFFWYFHTNSLSQAATSLLNYFQECKNKNQCPKEISLLWLRLQELCCELGKAYSYTMLFYLFYLFVSVMLIGYSAMANFGSMDFIVTAIGRFGLFFIGFLSLSIIPSLAHTATQRVVDDILNFVLRWVADEKNLVAARDLKWMAESVAIKKPAISLGGYVVLSRTVNISVSAL